MDNCSNIEGKIFASHICQECGIYWHIGSEGGLVKDHTFYGFFLHPSLRLFHPSRQRLDLRGTFETSDPESNSTESVYLHNILTMFQSHSHIFLYDNPVKKITAWLSPIDWRIDMTNTIPKPSTCIIFSNAALLCWKAVFSALLFLQCKRSSHFHSTWRLCWYIWWVEKTIVL